MRLAACAFAWLLSLPGSAAAWGALGHAVTCDIAFRELTPAARSGVLALIRADPDYGTFAEACSWADHVRDDDSYDWAAPYHFVNVPRGARTVSLRRDCQPRGCVIAGVYRYAGALADPGASRADRVAALKFLGHFVADLHQPMHVSFFEDRGGNRIGVRFFDDVSNLHAVWDTGMIVRAGRDWRELGRALQRSITDAEREAWAGGGPVQWANESHRIALDPATRYVDAPTCCTELGQDYLDANLSKAHQRLRQGGYRLSVVLNGIWKDGS